MAENNWDWSFLRWTPFPTHSLNCGVSPQVKLSPASNRFFYCWRCPQHAHRSFLLPPFLKAFHSTFACRSTFCPSCLWTHHGSVHSVMFWSQSAPQLRRVLTALLSGSEVTRKPTWFLPERNVKIKDIISSHGWSWECGDGSCSFGFV